MASGRFQKGKSGNPGGRPKILAALQANQLDTKSLTAELVGELIDAVRSLDRKSASWRFSIETLLNHVVGRPKEFVEHTFGQGEQERDMAEYSDEELDVIIAQGRAEPDDPAVH